MNNTEVRVKDMDINVKTNGVHSMAKALEAFNLHP